MPKLSSGWERDDEESDLMPGRLKRIQVAIAVMERNGRYLISRRHQGDHLGGFWEFPGGKRRVGESWEACLCRELIEELGIEVHPWKRLPSLSFRYPDRQVCLAVFWCTIRRGSPQPLDCQEVRWVPAQQLHRYRFPPADRQLIQQLWTTTPLHRPAHRDIIRLRVKKQSPSRRKAQ